MADNQRRIPEAKKNRSPKEISDQRGGECGILYFQSRVFMANAAQ